MNHFTKIGDYQTDDLADELDENTELWGQHTIRRDSIDSPHLGMTDIWVRYNDVTPFEENGDYSTFNDPHIPIWYPAWEALPSLRPIIFDLMREVEGEMLGGVLITKIPPGGGIKRHADFGWHVEYYEKFYVCIQNDPGAVFYCEDGGVTEGLEPIPGECWLFDNRKHHWVENKSAVDRITLIVCIRTEMFGRL